MHPNGLGNSIYMKTILTKKTYFYHYCLPYKVSICENVWILGKFFHFLVHKSHRNSKNYIFFMVLELFANWNLVNSNDKSKLVKRAFMQVEFPRQDYLHCKCFVCSFYLKPVIKKRHFNAVLKVFQKGFLHVFVCNF